MINPTNLRLIRSVSVLVIMILVLAACSEEEEPEATTVPTVEPTPAGMIVLSDIDADDPISKVEEFQPIADYLAANLGEYGIGAGGVKIAPDLDTLIQWIESGEVDLFYDSLYPAMIVSDATGAQPLLRGWRGGEPVYHTVIFVKADSGITSIDDLKGKTIAFDDPFSTTGFMLPMAHLISNDLTMTEKQSPEDEVADDEIGYIFSGDDGNAIEWVLGDLVSAAAIDNLTYVNEIPEETRAALVIVAETEEIPRRVLMIRSGLDPQLVEALTALFVGMDEDEAGQAVLEILGTRQFDEFPEGTEGLFAEIRTLYETVVNATEQ